MSSTDHVTTLIQGNMIARINSRFNLDMRQVGTPAYQRRPLRGAMPWDAMTDNGDEANR